MRTSKKILMYTVSFLVTLFISLGLAAGTELFTGFSYKPLTFFFFCIQLAASFYITNIYESRNVIKAVQEYASKPYKKYILPINCGHCGQSNEIEIDLTDTEFKCTNCSKMNGIHISFMGSAITEPINTDMF
jgi:hypothetical protein